MLGDKVVHHFLGKEVKQYGTSGQERQLAVSQSFCAKVESWGPEGHANQVLTTA